MTLTDIEIKHHFDSERDNLLEDFYIPVLSNTIKYDRIAGFFNSSALAIAAKGIAQFALNGGKMRLIVSAQLDKKDVESISAGYLSRDDVISKKLEKTIDELEDDMTKDHVKALGFMIANGLLDIRIAIIKKESGELLSHDEVDTSALFHQKVGIFTDAEGSSLSFSGSINESARGWNTNVEEFKIFRSWYPDEAKYLDADIDKFNYFWNNKSERVILIEVPEAAKKKLIEYAPPRLHSLSRIFYNNTINIILKPYQETCVDEWFKAGKIGLAEMATGTGKTYTAIACLKKLTEVEKRLGVIVTVPYTHLIDQWKKSLRDWGFTTLVEIYGGITDWERKLVNEISDLNNGYSNLTIIITTHDTFSSNSFVTAITTSKVPLMLIADEVHAVGSDVRQEGLIAEYKFRIGLSATPSRYFDDEGTQALMSYFGKTIFEFPLEKAIPEYLTPYEYHPHFIELNSDELERYQRETRKIAAILSNMKKDPSLKALLDTLLIKRQKIITNAEGKIPKFVEIIDSIDNINHCLVYASDRQLPIVQEILNSKMIMQHKFTAKESPAERKMILQGFASGKYRVLPAINCLDEGVDVPSTETAIILASSGNPKQFIQRRGRVLRKYPGKDHAIIHDIVVIPIMKPNKDDPFFNFEQKIIQKELKRFEEMANSSLNPKECLYKIGLIKREYGL
jgi:superfamily II DNA or RNA helicase